MDERGLIEWMRAQHDWQEGIPGLGIGDDAAFLLLSSMEYGKLLLSTDSMVENVHYSPDWCSYKDVAHKLFEMNASDVLVKGGAPHWGLLNINATPAFMDRKDHYAEFINELFELFKAHKVYLIGGDITRSSVNTFTLTLLGNCHHFVYRKNKAIKNNDIIVIHGDIGGSSFALSELIEMKKVPEAVAMRYRRPQAKWDNQWILEDGVLATIDQSDSLYESFVILARENNIIVDIDLDRVPVSPEVKEELQALPEEKRLLNLLASAEDFAAIAIISSEKRELLAKHEGIIEIGVVSGDFGSVSGGEVLINLSGNRVPQEKLQGEIPLQFNHFR